MSTRDRPFGRRIVAAIWGGRAPFGRIGEALGFRWIMPIGTIPLPFHPLVARLLPWSILALVAWRLLAVSAGADGGVSWRTLFVAAGLLAVPMAIPIVQWLAMAFRVPLLQGLLIAAAMALLFFDAAAGAAPPWAGAVPAAWLGLWLTQHLAGPAYLRRLQAANAAFGRIDPGDRLVIMERDRVAGSYANHLSFEYALARVAVEPDPRQRSNRLKEQTYHRLSPEDWPTVAERIERLQPRGWQVIGERIVTPGIADPGSRPAIRVRMKRHRAPLWLVGGHREMLEIIDGRTVHRLVGGKAALAGRWPLFVCFYYLNIFNGCGGANGQLVVGFAPAKEVDLGTTRFWDMVPRVFAPLAETKAPPYADAAPLHAMLDALEEEMRVGSADLLGRLLRLDANLPFMWPRHIDKRALAAGHGPELCDCLAAAKETKSEDAARMAAQLLAALPPDEFAALSERLLVLLNSKELAFRILADGVDPNASEAERRKHIVGGLSLLRSVPELYERLGELGEPARPLVMAMGRLGRWPEALVNARERLNAARPANS